MEIIYAPIAEVSALEGLKIVMHLVDFISCLCMLVCPDTQQFVVQWCDCSYYPWFFSPNQQKKRNCMLITLVQVGIATRYGLDGPAIESRWARDFPHPSNGPGDNLASYTMGTGFFPGLKRLKHGVDQPLLPSAEI